VKQEYRVLVFEDNPDHAEIVRRSFQRSGELYSVDLVPSVKQGLELLQSRVFDILISDWILTDGTAQDLISNLTLSEIPVIVMTSHGDEKIAVDALKAGALDYLVKSETTLLDLPHFVQNALKHWNHLQEKKQSRERLEKIIRCLSSMGGDNKVNISSLVSLCKDVFNSEFCAYFKEEFGRVNRIAASGETRFYPLSIELKSFCLKSRLSDSTDTGVHVAVMECNNDCPIVKNCGSATVMSIPIRCRGQNVGLLCVCFEGRVVVKQDEHRFLGIISSAMGSVEERLYDEKDRLKLESQLRHLQRLESIGQLVGGIAHDFNNLLSPIIGYTEMVISRLPENDKNSKNLKSVKFAAEKARNLTRKLLTFGGKQILEIQEYDLVELLQSFIHVLKRTIREDIQLTFVSTENHMHARVDSTQIEQILMNLVINAQDAMPDGGKLWIRLSSVSVTEKDESLLNLASGNYVKLEVEDSGEGIPKDVLPKIFEPFFTTKERGKGTGLGLSTVYGAVKQHGGTVEVNSSESGTCFSIMLPLIRESVGVSKPGVTTEEQYGGGETILIAEDEPLVSELARQILCSRGYNVLCCSDVEAAINTAKDFSGEIHLIMADVIMPKMKGSELCKVVRNHRPDIKVLLMSGYPEAELINRLDDLKGAAAFLKKPFTVASLLKQVKVLLDS
jgi:signal transduction histidine kinase/DNA-binding response OmpR family regulator